MQAIASTNNKKNIIKRKKVDGMPLCFVNERDNLYFCLQKYFYLFIFKQKCL